MQTCNHGEPHFQPHAAGGPGCDGGKATRGRGSIGEGAGGEAEACQAAGTRKATRAGVGSCKGRIACRPFAPPIIMSYTESQSAQGVDKTATQQRRGCMQTPEEPTPPSPLPMEEEEDGKAKATHAAPVAHKPAVEPAAADGAAALAAEPGGRKRPVRLSPSGPFLGSMRLLVFYDHCGPRAG